MVPDDEIDLRELLLTLWVKRWIIVFSSIGMLALATFYAYVIVKPTFESSALLLPIQAPAVDQLGAAAAFLGKKGGGSSDVDLYQSLLTSRTVIHKLLRTPIRNESDSGKGRVEPLFHILGIDTSSPAQLDGAVNGLATTIMVNSKESGAGGLLGIKFVAGAPWLAQQIGNAVLAIGQEELRLVRIERSEVILSRLAMVVSQAKAEWDSSARALTWYRDRNRSIALPEQMLELSRLDIEKQAKEQKYLLVRKEYEMQMLERAKATPPMMILDPADLPSHKTNPRRAVIMALGLMVGFLGSSVGLMCWKALIVPLMPS